MLLTEDERDSLIEAWIEADRHHDGETCQLLDAKLRKDEDKRRATAGGRVLYLYADEGH